MAAVQTRWVVRVLRARRLHRCVRCRAAHVGATLACRDCQVDDSAARDELREQRRAEQRCTGCGGERDGGALCEACREGERLRKAIYRVALSGDRAALARAAATEAQRKRREDRIARGVCARCGANRTADGYIDCDPCRKEARNRYQRSK